MSDVVNGAVNIAEKIEIEEWYSKRYDCATRWEFEAAQKFGIQAKVERDLMEVGGRTSTPLLIMPKKNETEFWKVTVTDWDREIKETLIRVPPVPLYFMCMCKYYNLEYGTVKIERPRYDYELSVLGFQEKDDFFVTTVPYGARIPDRGNFMINRLKRRVEMYFECVNKGIQMECMDSKKFCLGGHGINRHKVFCWVCRGVKAGSGGNLRECVCVESGPGYLNDPTEVVIADEFTLHGQGPTENA
jgi:hypothetical protein